MDYEGDFNDYHQDESDDPREAEENLLAQEEVEEEDEFTDEELLQIGAVNYAAYTAVCDILHFDAETGDLPWDMEWIGELSDLIVGFICERFHKEEMEIYPYKELK